MNKGLNPNPIYYSETMMLGHVHIDFRGEQYEGHPITDTTVKIDGEQICAISWADKEAFMKELNEVISKYAI